MKRKFLGLAFVVIAMTITSICLCGFAPKIKDISDEEMNKVVFGAGGIIQPRALEYSSVPFDTMTLAVDHSVERGFPAIPTYGYAHAFPAASIANTMAYASRDLPLLIAEGAIYIGGSDYDSTGQAAKDLMLNLYNRAGLASGSGVTFENLNIVYNNLALERGHVASIRNVARYGREVQTVYLDRAMVEYNYPLHIYVEAAEIVQNFNAASSSLNFTSSMKYGNQVLSGHSYMRYRTVKDGVEHDEYLITVKNENGQDELLRLGGQTRILRIYAISYIIN